MHTKKLIDQDNVLLSQPELIKKFGRSSAQFLCQLHYWIEKEQGIVKDGVRWIYNSAKEWSEQLCLSQRQMQRIISDLADHGVIRIAKLSSIKQNRVNYFTIDKDVMRAISNDVSPTEKEQKSPETSVNDHYDILSQTLRHDGVMLLQILTNKDKNNKSDASDAMEHEQRSSQVVQVEYNNFNCVEDLENGPGKQVGEGTQKTSSPEILLTSKIPNTTVQDMVGVWNAAFPNTTEKLSKSLAPMLVSAFKTRFDGNIENFKHYCDLIQSSPYLMGEGFSLKLEWALKFKTIDRLMNGELGVKPIELKPAESSQQDKANMHIDALNEPENCKNVRRILLKKLGVDSYLSWFTQVDIIHRNGQIQIKPHNKFVQDKIEARFGDLMEMLKLNNT